MKWKFDLRSCLIGIVMAAAATAVAVTPEPAPEPPQCPVVDCQSLGCWSE